ncbi:alpha/beta hydrolase [Salisediminibacterium selenitireducens]|uniref:Dipeptidyl aminopeptidase/acylaminoacyl-peptidase-like protein n=1 Tax=Bacillus selenitireducens (strain ATCC 700615 / DSM 15326 / MLS10) TaxID=439292 RepID=D6XX44_BACIE|nr:alpha/beta fold hydrolase [Salisediminibacterium selenitireducens]ADI00021.1 Dipeptidyl aminopeptidase/acylaminoacyl-peptidase-like protein [[Bacillus] selenitireducens MLS10]
MYGHIPVHAPTKKRKSRKIQYLILFVLLLLIVTVALTVYTGLSMTRTEPRELSLNPDMYMMDYENVTFQSMHEDEVILQGWLMEPEADPEATVIMSHGYRGNRHESGAGFFALAQFLLNDGYRVLMYDFRNSGESDGTLTSIGVMERYDVLGAVSFIEDRYNEPIMLYGVSMGASASLSAAALTDAVSAVIADSPFSDLESYLEANLPVWTNLPSFPFTPLTMGLIPRLTGITPSELSPVNDLDAIYPRSVLFIHGDEDEYIPHSESIEMASQHEDAFEIWIPEGADHVQGFYKHPEAYMTLVKDFLAENR